MFGNSALKEKGFKVLLGTILFCLCIIISPSSARAAAVSWTDATGNWDVGGNWSGGAVPGAADDATINVVGAQTITVRTTGGPFTINSLTMAGDDILAMTGSSLTVNNAFTNNANTNISGGSLILNGVSSMGSLTQTGGTLGGTGTVSISGLTTWSSGTMTGLGTTNANGGINISGQSTHELTVGRTLTTAGTATWSGNTGINGGQIRTGGGATINNTGVWQDQNVFDSQINNAFGGGGTFNNTGTYTKSGAGTTTISIGFNNTKSGDGTGVVNVNAGGLILSGGGTANSGSSFSGLAGTTLGLGGGYTAQLGSAINTAGAVDFVSGTNSVAGSYSATEGTDFSGGTTTFTGTVTGVGPSLTASAGTGIFNNLQAITTTAMTLSGGAGGLTFNNTGGASTTTLNLSGGTLGGTSNVAVSGLTTWTSGTMTGLGTTNANGGINISGQSTHELTVGRTLTTAGTATWSGNTGINGGQIRTGGGATINNTGVWQDQNVFDSQINNAFGGGGTFNNTGTYTKSGAGETTISIGFNNTKSGDGTGVVNVNAGGLILSGGGTANSGSSFTGLAGTTLGIGGGYTAQLGSAINTAGAVAFGSGTNSVAGSYSATEGTDFSGGTTTFTGTVTGVGPSLTASGGTGIFNNGQAITTTAMALSSGGLTFSNTGGASTTTLNLSGGTLGGTSNVAVSGLTTWTGGTMTGLGTTNANGGINISGQSTHELTVGRTLTTAGTATWSGNTGINGGQIRTGGGATINNTGVWQDQNVFDSQINNAFGGGGTFNNTGTYTKSGAGTTTISIGFNNTKSGDGTGVVNVNAGGLILSGGGTANSGSSFTGLAGTTLGIGGGYTAQLGSAINTAGAVAFGSGTNSVAGSYAATQSTTFSSGTTTFTGTSTVTGVGSTLTASGGTGIFNNGQAITTTAMALSSGGLTFSNTGGASTTTLNLSGGTLGGTSNVAVSGLTTWTGGTMTGLGTTNANGGINISGQSTHELTVGRTLTTAGTATWSGNTGINGGQIRTGGGATINNTGVWQDQNVFDSQINNAFGGGGTFNNTGTYTKSGAGTTTISIGFNNTKSGDGTGVVNVNAGGLILSGGGTANSGSSFSGLAGTTLEFGGGTYDLLAGSTVNAPDVTFSGGTANVAGSYTASGTTRVNGGTANFTATVANVGGSLLASSGIANFNNSAGVTFSTINLSGATIGGTQTVTSSGLTTWTSGTMTGAGTTNANGGINISGNGTHILTGRTLAIAGTATWSGNTANNNGLIYTGSGATINNTGLWQDQNAFNSSISNVYGGPASVFNNTGTYTKSGAGETTISIDVNNVGGLIQSTAGVITFQNNTISGGNVQANGAGARVDLDSGGVFAGTTLSVSGGGEIRILNNTTLDGSTGAGAVNTPLNLTYGNSTTNYIKGIINNTGSMTLNSTGGYVNVMIPGGPNATATLQGGGSVMLSNQTLNRIYGNSNSNRLINVDNTISGAGQIGVNLMNLTNNALINANQTSSLTIDPTDGAGGVINTGILRSSNSGGLVLQSGTFVNTDGVKFGRIEAAGGNVTLDSATVQGGTFASSSGGKILVTGSSTLDGGSAAGQINNSGSLEFTNSTTNYIKGIINNTGAMTLNSTGGYVNVMIPGGPNATATLQGGGSVMLSNQTLNRIYGNSNSNRLINVDNTISGAGQIGVNLMNLTNNALINANQTSSLTIDPTDGAGGVINTGILRSSNSGGLVLQSGTFVNTDGVKFGRIEAAGGNVTLDSATVQGGTFASSSGGKILVTGSSTLDGGSAAGQINNSGSLEFTNSTTNYIKGIINNTGAMTLNATSGTVDVIIPGGPNATATLQGGGSVMLSNQTLNRIYGNSNSNRLINVDNTISGAGQIGVNLMAFTNQAAGLVHADQSNALTINPTDGLIGGLAGVINAGVFRASGAGGLVLDPGTYDNTGTFEALNGSNITMQANAVLSNNLAGTLTGGIYRSIATGSGATVSINGNPVVTNASDITLSGDGSVFRVRNGSGSTFTPLEDSLSLTTIAAAGALRVLDNRNYTTANAITNAGILQLGGGTFDAASVMNQATGQIFGFGTLADRPTNSGIIRATGGTLVASLGIQGGSGTVQIDPGATLNLSGAGTSSSADFLVHNGSTAGSLNLGGNNFVVTKDYTNANFGIGNTFNARANVVGAGLITGNNASQTITGNVSPASADTWTLNIGNVRGGTSTTVNYQIANNGTGADIRGAVQTGAPGLGNITDGRLSGGGVTAGNFGPIAAAGNSGNQPVTFTATSGGLLAGQSIAVVSNFGNVNTQVINLSGTASALAQGAATPNANPVILDNFRVIGALPSQAFAVENTTSGAGAERLGIASVGTSGNFSAINNLGAGFINGGASQADAVSASVSGGAVGINNGSVTIQYTTNGELIDPSFTTINANAQTINLRATGYNAAQGSTAPSPITIANQRVGGTNSQLLTVSNTAPAGSFSEALNAGFGANTGNATNNGGSVMNMIAGGSNGINMSVGVDTSSAGAKSGTVTIAYQTDGTGPNGNSGLSAISAGMQTVTVSGDVYRLATTSAHTPEPVNLGTIHVGGSFGTQALSLQNTATNDGYSEKLNASINGATGAASTNLGSFTLLAPQVTNNTNLVVGLGNANTSVAGAKSGQATITLASDGSGTSNLGLTALPSQTVNVSGTVNNWANPVFNKLSGAGTLSGSGNSFTLALGTLTQGGSNVSATLGLKNDAAIPADWLNGDFTLSSDPAFTLTGFTSFSNLLAGTAKTDLIVQLTAVNAGDFYYTILLKGISGNNSSSTALADVVTLNLTGSVAPVPIPPAVWLFASGLIGIIGIRRRVTGHKEK